MQIFTNNIVVSLFAMALGVLYGLGTIYIIGMNGFMLGGVFAFTAQHGIANRLFQFVVAHGFVELSVVCIAGAVGASLGEALARPGELPRGAAFQAAVARGMQLMAVCLVFLVGAGLIEGFISPDPRVPLGVRLAIGLTYLALFLLVLSGALGGWGRGGVDDLTLAQHVCVFASRSRSSNPCRTQASAAPWRNSCAHSIEHRPIEPGEA